MSRRLQLAALFALACAAAVVLGVVGGASASGFGAFEDEPAHVATALMIRDWFASFEPLHPLRFAEDYYAAYPKVAIGQWPPVYHTALGLWLLVFGVSAGAVLALSWLFIAGAGWLAARTVTLELAEDDTQRLRGGVLALAATAAVLTVSAPLVQSVASCAMTEGPIALVGTLAALAFARWMARPGVGAALGFGLAAVAAILTKGSGLALALVPPLALLLARRPRLALQPSIWAAPVIVGVLCAPWYVLSLPIVRASWNEGASPSLEYVRRALTYYPPEVVALGGSVVLALAAIGAAERLSRPAGRERAAALTAWLLALSLLYCTVPSSLEARHLVAGAPALAALAALGAHACVRALVARGAVRFAGASRTPIVAAMLLGLPFLATTFRVERKDVHGFDEAARVVLANAALAGDTVLVASGASGEGLGVLGFALQEEPRRSRQVLRASKVLASASWIGAGYSTRFEHPEEVAAWLADVPVSVVLLDGATPARHRGRHLEQLRTALEGSPTVWRRAGTLDVTVEGALHPGALEVWIADAHASRTPRRLGFDETRGNHSPTF